MITYLLTLIIQSENIELKKKTIENLIEHTREINVTKCVHMEPENFNTLQEINVGNKQGVTNAAKKKPIFLTISTG